MNVNQVIALHMSPQPAPQRQGNLVELGLLAEMTDTVAAEKDTHFKWNDEMPTRAIIVRRGYVHLNPSLHQAARDKRERKARAALRGGKRRDDVENLQGR